MALVSEGQFSYHRIKPMLDRRKPLDHAFLESMRDRIEVARIIDKLQDHVKDPDTYPMSGTQLKASQLLLAKCMPDLKAVEHTDAPARELTREELIERLTQLHGGSTAAHDSAAAQGNGAVDRATPLPH